MVDFAEVKERVSITQTLEKLGIGDMRVAGSQLRGQCPICHNPDKRGFTVNPTTSLFYCFKGCAGGDQITLVSKVKGLSLRDAATWLIGEATAPKERTVPQEQPERSQPFHPLAYLEPEHEAVLAVGFNPAFAKRVGIGYAPKGVAKGSVLLPIRDEEGRLEGYVGVQEVTYIPADFQLPTNVVQLKKA